MLCGLWAHSGCQPVEEGPVGSISEGPSPQLLPQWAQDCSPTWFSLGGAPTHPSSCVCEGVLLPPVGVSPP
jgi:hypothetical protein